MAWAHGQGTATAVDVVASRGACGGAWQLDAEPGRSGFGDPVGVRVDWPGVRRMGRPGGFAGVRRRRRPSAGRQGREMKAGANS